MVVMRLASLTNHLTKKVLMILVMLLHSLKYLTKKVLVMMLTSLTNRFTNYNSSTNVTGTQKSSHYIAGIVTKSNALLYYLSSFFTVSQTLITAHGNSTEIPSFFFMCF